MTAETLAAALEREHHEIDAEIDAEIEEFLAAPAQWHAQAEPLRRAMDALRRHIYLEEAFLFPPLSDAGLVAPIFVMLREHGEIWDTMDAIEAELRANSEDGAGEAICRELRAQLERHNSKEEPIIYPQADAVLTDSAGAELRAFLAAGHMPAGWVCEQASA